MNDTALKRIKQHYVVIIAMAVTGLQRLNRKLTKEIPKRAYDVIRAAMEKNANEIVAEMKRFAPVDMGDLQMSITWCWGNAPKGTLVAGHVTSGRGRRSRTFSQGSDTGLRISIYAGGGDEYYAWFVEFGTKNMDAQPFFFPIFRMKRQGAKARITRAVSKAIKESAIA